MHTQRKTLTTDSFHIYLHYNVLPKVLQDTSRDCISLRVTADICRDSDSLWSPRFHTTLLDCVSLWYLRVTGDISRDSDSLWSPGVHRTPLDCVSLWSPGVHRTPLETVLACGPQGITGHL